jgi:hypothetical protein
VRVWVRVRVRSAPSHGRRCAWARPHRVRRRGRRRGGGRRRVRQRVRQPRPPRRGRRLEMLAAGRRCLARRGGGRCLPP